MDYYDPNEEIDGLEEQVRAYRQALEDIQAYAKDGLKYPDLAKFELRNIRDVTNEALDWHRPV